MLLHPQLLASAPLDQLALRGDVLTLPRFSYGLDEVGEEVEVRPQTVACELLLAQILAQPLGPRPQLLGRAAEEGIRALEQIIEEAAMGIGQLPAERLHDAHDGLG